MPARVSADPRNLIRRLQLRLATELAVGRARATTLQRSRTLAFCRILVLCYGNIYRSPLVSAGLNRAFSGNDDVQVRSAGFYPQEGRSARDEFILQVRDQLDLDLSGHKSRVVDIADIEWADSIVIMDRHNWHALAKLDTGCLEKVIWLGGFLSPGRVEIADPYGLTEPEIHRVIDQLNVATRKMVDQIKSGRKP